MKPGGMAPPGGTEAECDPQRPPQRPPQRRPQRRICTDCNRPARVCLCHVLPAAPLPTRARVLVVQHPLEARHKLNTAAVLPRCLARAGLVRARRLAPDFRHPLLSADAPTFYLFPPTRSAPAITLSQLRDELAAAAVRDSGDGGAPAVNLIAFDATWAHAREMVGASEQFLSRAARRVCLDGFDTEADGPSIFESELILRKEPCAGCVSTAEAVARCVAVVEPDGGPAIAERVVDVLREMVRLQAQFIKPTEPRRKMLKKNKRGSRPSNEGT